MNCLWFAVGMRTVHTVLRNTCECVCGRVAVLLLLLLQVILLVVFGVLLLLLCMMRVVVIVRDIAVVRIRVGVCYVVCHVH